ncbi:MAG: MotA/TolQ/ExbB proton channel family protein [Candidatus Competibacteraceae bacterium]|nr:MotA/TolQ/ExbB proton channel family protein [Candidatus Competibacteraceae bacterium]
MVELFIAGGWLMWPILLCSIVAMTIVVERLWSLRLVRVLPPNLVKALHHWSQGGKITHRITPDNLTKLAQQSPLGRIVAAALLNREQGREIVKESVEDSGRQVVHELERFLNTLGTIAAITPLLGLLGTVFGMIQVFTVISVEGTGNAELLAGGISKALITTATGLTVAIPSLLFHRYFTGRVDELVIRMEDEAIRLVDIIHHSTKQPGP